MIGVLVKMIIYGILVRVVVNVKIDEYLNTKSCSSKNRLIGKLVLACEDKV